MSELATIFESFNARALAPAQIASRFVPPPQFGKLIRRRHTIVVGPRGSGKTTLLKMLHPQALEAWDGEEAEEFRAQVDFTGVFVAADVSWSEQLQALGAGKLDPETHRIYVNSAFTTHVLRALVNSMLSRLDTSHAAFPFRRVQLTPQSETAIVRALADSWHVTPAIPSLLGLRQALTAKLSLIHSRASEEAIRGGAGRMERIADTKDLHIHFLSAVALAIELFNDAAGEPSSRWALLFDELELAPAWISEELIAAMRSTDERILFKLAMSPFSAEASLLRRVTTASPGEDFEQIPLWYAERNDGYEFCERLWYSLLFDRGHPPTRPSDVLGSSYFDTPRSAWLRSGSAYHTTSRWGKRIKRLAEKDRTFQAYLDGKGLSPSNLEKVPGKQRAAELRKIAPLIPVRDFYRSHDSVRESEGGQRSRGRKTPTLYAGAHSVFGITEGNPRWFLGILEGMLDAWRGPGRRISAPAQARELDKASSRFSALLRTIPGSKPEPTSGQVSVSWIADKIGSHFHHQAVERDFIAEPSGTFIVDPGTPPAIRVVLSRAVNAGAIVFVPDGRAHLLLDDLVGLRFRLSYLLAPKYGFPLRLGKHVNLSTLIRSGGGYNEGQESLPLGGE